MSGQPRSLVSGGSVTTAQLGAADSGGLLLSDNLQLYSGTMY